MIEFGGKSSHISPFSMNVLSHYSDLHLFPKGSMEQRLEQMLSLALGFMLHGANRFSSSVT
jgi:hypothetical protein